jgi:hypothetical protein
MMTLQTKVFPRTLNAVTFVSGYADEHLCVAGAPTGHCDGCEHYRTADDDDDWCWLKEGKYTDGREHECLAWKSHNAEVS